MSDKNFWQKLKKPILALAPMAGITDSSFRLICKEFGADVVYTEMVSVAGLYYGNNKTERFLKFDKKEKPIVLQLFGFEPKHFKTAAQKAEQAGFSGVDINFGCPAKKIVKNFSGIALMDDLDKAYQIVKTVCESTTLPVSIKIRNSKGKIRAMDLIKKIKNLPVQAIMLHARSYEQGFKNEPDWQEFITLRVTTHRVENLKIRKIYQGILLANGGINTPQIAKQVLKDTQADGIGLARGVWGKPWLFQQIKDYLKTGKYFELDWSMKKKIILKHAKLILQNKKNLAEMRKHLLWYIKGIPEARKLRSKLMLIKNLEELNNLLKKLD